MKTLLLIVLPTWLLGQAPKDTVNVSLAAANAATIYLNNAYKNTFILLNNYIGIAAKRQESLLTQLALLNSAKNKTQDSLLIIIQRQTASIASILVKEKLQDSIISVLLKKRTQDSIANQHDLITGKKDQILIKQLGAKKPYTFEFWMDPVFTNDYAALKKAYDALKKRMDAYDASRGNALINSQK